MAVLKRILPIIAGCAMLTGCYTDFDPHLDSTSVLCMNSLITSGEPLTLRLTRTWAWNEGDPGENIDIDISEAEVSLYVNGEFKEKLEPCEVDDPYDWWLPYRDTHPGFKAPSYIPRPGDRIRLVAVNDVYGEASAEVTMPPEVPIDRVETNIRSFYEDQNGRDTSISLDMLVYFTDPAGPGNDYMLDVAAKGYRNDDSGAYEYFKSMYLDMSREPLFSEHVSALESVITDTSGYTIFSDRQIDGKTYPLHVSMEFGYTYYNPADIPGFGVSNIEVALMSISPDYYKHVLSVWETNDGIVGSLGSIGLGEMVYTHSNVSTDAGIVAACTPSRFSLPIQSLISEYKKQLNN